MGGVRGRTCFSDLGRGLDLVNVFFLFSSPFNRFVPSLSLFLHLFVPDFCHLIVCFKSVHVFFAFLFLVCFYCFILVPP